MQTNLNIRTAFQTNTQQVRNAKNQQVISQHDFNGSSGNNHSIRLKSLKNFYAQNK